MEPYYKHEARSVPQNPPPSHNRMAIANLVHAPPISRRVSMSGRIQPPQVLNQPATHYPGGASSHHNVLSLPPMHIPPPTSHPPASQSDTNAGNISPSVAFDTYPHDLTSQPPRQQCDNCGVMYVSDSAGVYQCGECVRFRMMHGFPRPLGQAAQHGVSPQQSPPVVLTSAATSIAGHHTSSPTALTADDYLSDEDAGTPGPGAASLGSGWPFFGNATKPTTSRSPRPTPTKKHDGSGFRKGYIPKSPTAPVSAKNPAVAKRTRAARTTRAKKYQEQGSLRARVEKELQERLQQLINEEEVWKVETEHIKKELQHIRLSVSEAKNGLIALCGVEVGRVIESDIESTIDARGLLLPLQG